MQVKNVIPKPFEESISPAISFDVEIAYTKHEEAIVEIKGFLESEDGKVLANVFEFTQQKRARLSHVGARGSRHDSTFKEEVHNATLFAPLSREAVDYIEKQRMANTKKDVYLALNLDVRSIVGKALVSHVYDVDPKSAGIPVKVKVISESGRPVEGKILAFGYDPYYTTGQTNRWIISGNSGPFFLSVKEENLDRKSVRIPSTDWIHDYAPKLRLGEYFVVEIPKGSKVVEKAWEYVQKAEESYRRWDTKGAYGNCREAGYLLDGVVKKKFGKSDFEREKWSRTYQRFEKLASLSLHLEDLKKSPKYSAEDVKIGKVDVEHVLIVTKALIKYAGELLQEKP